MYHATLLYDLTTITRVAKLFLTDLCTALLLYLSGENSLSGIDHYVRNIVRQTLQNTKYYMVFYKLIFASNKYLLLICAKYDQKYQVADLVVLERGKVDLEKYIPTRKNKLNHVNFNFNLIIVGLNSYS